MEENRLKVLLNKYHEHNLSHSELSELNDWFHSVNLGFPEFEKWVDNIKDEKEYVANSLMNFKNRLHVQQLVKVRRRRWLTAAASLLIFMTAFSVYLLKEKYPVRQIVKGKNEEIIPGGNNAVLTLNNGRKIALNNVKDGKLALQGKTVISKTSEGKIVYNNQTAKNALGETSFNTITTPRGGTYQVVLSDGTKAWLNAASSIKFPVAFNGNSREVVISGEALFQVAHSSKPFRVICNGQIVEDLGTVFDVNSYDDEPGIKTTLLEGSVRVIISNTLNNLKKTSLVLKPGQQAILANNNFKIQNPNADEVIAWKNGKFFFDNEQLVSIMRQASRWYDVEIVYEDEKLKKYKFSGVTTRFADISQLLTTLEMTNKVKFKVQGKQITVQNK